MLPDGVAYKEWETIKVKQLKAATLEKLVEHLTSCTSEAMDWDPGFLMAFLCTYKSFATTDEVVDLLLERYFSFSLFLYYMPGEFFPQRYYMPGEFFPQR